MANHRIRKGLDIPIAGAASGEVIQLDVPETIAIDPRELRGFIPRLAAREGERVSRGQTLFYHKFDPDIRVVSPVSGTVKEVKRGHRRVITDFVVEVGEGDTVQHPTYTLEALKGISGDDARKQILEGGGWPFLRTRPLDHIADPKSAPQAILICGTETGPLQPGADVLLGVEDRDALQAAVYALQSMTEGRVYITAEADSEESAMWSLDGVVEHTFSGPHPAGDAGVQVNHIEPPVGTQRVWWIHAWDAVTIGRLFLNGHFDGERIYAAVGLAVKTPRFVRTVLGAPLAHLTGDTTGDNLRWIRGSVLTGDRSAADRWSGFYSRAVHVLSDEIPLELLGWARPMLSKWSFYRAYLSGFMKSDKTYDLRPGLYGGHRSIVPTGHYRDVVATPDIVPSYLFKAIISGDLERSIELGMLDITEEEAALCSYICPSKTDFDVILRNGLDVYAKEA
jgi:Na+-transporting NADH:ubiquinone oxidoreductase subunit A